MSKEKRYYWLKLKNDFFYQKEIKMLRKLAGGDTYTIIYLKMLLLSLENDGKIYFDGIASNMIEEISLEIDENVENTQITFNYLLQKGLIELGPNDDLDMMTIGEMIGSESASARRVRKHRRQKALQSNNDVTDVKRLSNTEIEIEKEIEKELEPEPEKEPEKSSDDADDLKTHNLKLANNFFQQNFGILTEHNMTDLSLWIDDIGIDLVMRALEIAAEHQANYAYAKGIMRNWDKKGIKTLEDVEAADVAHSNKQNKKRGNRPQKVESVPDWLNDDFQQKNKLSDTEVEQAQLEISERLKEIEKMRSNAEFHKGD